MTQLVHTAALCIAALSILAAVPAFAADIEQGKRDFVKCKACHSIVAPDGEVIVKGGKTGPNLWGVFGRQAGGLEGFDGFGESITALGATGFAWSEPDMVEYARDPLAFLESRLGSAGTKSTMSFKLRDPDDVVAYLASLGTN